MKRGKILLLVLFTACILLPLVSNNLTTYAVEEQVTNAEMLDMCARVKGFLDTYGSVPQFVWTNASQTTLVSAGEMFYMMARWIGYYKDKGVPPNYVIIYRNIAGPSNPSGVETGTIYQAEILNEGREIADYIAANLIVPNFCTVGQTQYTPEAMYSVMARTINWYKENNYIPNYATVVAVDAPLTWTYQDPEPTPTPDPYPWSRTLSVPYTAQPDSYTCGPTSTRMIMSYYGTWYTVSAISNYMASWGDSPYYDGVGPAAIVAAGQHYGFSATAQKYGLTELKNAIQNGHPVVGHLQIFGGGSPRYYPSGTPLYSSFTGGHYVAVVGLKADANGNVLYVVINDPSKGSNIKVTYASFDYSWNEKGRRIIKFK